MLNSKPRLRTGLLSRSLWITLLAVSGVLGADSAGRVAVSTGSYDAARTSSNLNESRLTLSNVNPETFGKLWTLPVDGQVYAQPLYLAGVAVPDKGTRNVLYVATMHNSVYAFDADPSPAHEPLWKVSFGTPVPAANYSDSTQFTDIALEAGILSTPVMDPAANTLYVVSSHYAGGRYYYLLHALDLGTGTEKQNGPVEINATAKGTGDDSSDGVIAFRPFWHIQRPALTLTGGNLYIAFGSHADSGVYHGWLISYDAADITRQTGVFNTTPDGFGGSIWMSGRGLAVDDEGNLYGATGNGFFDGRRSFGESILKLSGTQALALLDWFTPSNYEALNDADRDLGSCGPLLIPGTKLLVTAGKEGVVYVMDRGQMGQLTPSDSGLVQRFAAVKQGVFNMALWNRAEAPVLYVQGFGEPLKAFVMKDGQFQTDAASQGLIPQGLPFGGIVVTSAPSGDSAHGIVWQTTTLAGPRGQAWPGALHAYDAGDLTKELWNSDMIPDDRLPSFAKFVAPTIVQGRVYVPTFSNQIVVYGLKEDGQQVLQDIDVVNALSLLPGPVSPGQLIQVTGTGIGPDEEARYVPDSSGYLPTRLAGVKVLFDGQAASLVSASAERIVAVVPYAVASKQTTLLQVSYLGLTSPTTQLAVAGASPGLAVVPASGQGQVLNEDGSLNTPDKPAARGSVVSIEVTGVGVTRPYNEALDETGINGLAVPESPLEVRVSGLKAEVVYAGGNKGDVGAVLTVRFRIPQDVMPGSVVPLYVSADGTPSQAVAIAVQ